MPYLEKAFFLEIAYILKIKIKIDLWSVREVYDFLILSECKHQPVVQIINPQHNWKTTWKMSKDVAKKPQLHNLGYQPIHKI